MGIVLHHTLNHSPTLPGFKSNLHEHLKGEGIVENQMKLTSGQEGAKQAHPYFTEGSEEEGLSLGL